MPIGSIKAKLRDKKDHFVVTLYKDVREELNIYKSNIILFEINNKRLVRIPNKDFHISIPKKFIKTNQKVIKIKVLGIYDTDCAKLRETKLFFDKYLNIKAFIPKKTIYGHDIYIIEEGDELLLWYSVGGGVNPLKIKNRIDYEKIAELIGFYFGDGNTSDGIRSFRLNNCEPSTLNYCLDVLKGLGIYRKDIKVQIIYSSNKELDNVIKNRCILFWSNKLKINKNQIVSVNRSKNKRETLKYGSARIFLDNSILVELFLHGILKKFVKFVENPRNKLERRITIGFFRGLLAAEGFSLLHNNSLRRVGVSFNPHSDELKLYKRILWNLDIDWKYVHGNAILIQRFENFKKLFEIDAFKLHKKRKEKFLLGYRNHKFFI